MQFPDVNYNKRVCIGLTGRSVERGARAWDQHPSATAADAYTHTRTLEHLLHNCQVHRLLI